jgi:hypothetical protein
VLTGLSEEEKLQGLSEEEKLHSMSDDAQPERPRAQPDVVEVDITPLSPTVSPWKVKTAGFIWGVYGGTNLVINFLWLFGCVAASRAGPGAGRPPAFPGEGLAALLLFALAVAADKPHVSFATSAHACLGMGLARLELEVALRILFGRFPHLRLDPGNPPRRRCETLMFRGFEALPTLTS